MIPNDCRTEVRTVFQKLTSWKDEVSDIIESHRLSISKGVNNLVTEVSEMQEELSVIKKERDMLRQEVGKLNEENRRLSAKLDTLEPAEVNLEQVGFPQMNFRLKPEDKLDVQNEVEDGEYDEGMPDATAEQDMDMLNEKSGSDIYETEHVDANFFESTPVMLPNNQEIAAPENAVSEDNEGPDVKSQGSLQFGMTYPDYPSFHQALQEHENENLVHFSQRTSARNHSEIPEISDKTLFPFKRLYLSCTHSSTIKRWVGKKRPNQAPPARDCKAKIGLTLITHQVGNNFGKYRVTTFDSNHSKHDVNETSFKMQSQRKFKSSRKACQI